MLNRRDMHLERLYGYISNQIRQVEHMQQQESVKSGNADALRRQHELYGGYDKQALVQRVIEMENSSSWRMTAPLRLCKRMLVRLRRKLKL